MPSKRTLGFHLSKANLSFMPHLNKEEKIDGSILRIKSNQGHVNEYFFKNLDLYNCKTEEFTYEGKFTHQKVN
jgi:hypothetical protein